MVTLCVPESEHALGVFTCFRLLGFVNRCDIITTYYNNIQQLDLMWQSGQLPSWNILKSNAKALLKKRCEQLCPGCLGLTWIYTLPTNSIQVCEVCQGPIASFWGSLMILAWKRNLCLLHGPGFPAAEWTCGNLHPSECSPKSPGWNPPQP